MTTYQILYWHDIPLQVRAGGRRERFSVELPQHFQIAVDNAAMAAGLTGTDAYLSAFEWSGPVERDGTPAEVATAVAQELQSTYPSIDWRKTVETIHQSQADG